MGIVTSETYADFYINGVKYRFHTQEKDNGSRYYGIYRVKDGKMVKLHWEYNKRMKELEKKKKKLITHKEYIAQLDKMIERGRTDGKCPDDCYIVDCFERGGNKPCIKIKKPKGVKK
jgi:major membrane immunogen (membrane-anchored lipoprotein)